MVSQQPNIVSKREVRFRKEKKRILAKLKMLRAFGDTSDAAKRERIERCRGKENLLEFGKTYLPHYFTTKTQAEWHDEYIKSFTIEEQVVTIIAPRGEAKSTIGSFADILHDVVYGSEEFIVLAMENLTKATMQTWRILLELKYNQLLINDFGQLVDDEGSRSDFTTIATDDHPLQIRVAALGGGQSARGMISGPHRPSKFICDDIESRKVAKNPEQVEKFVDIIDSDYVYAMKAQGWKFRVVGTLICRGSVLDTLRKNKEDKHYHFKAIENLGTPDERSTWEEHSPLELLKKLMKRGISKFMSEKQGEPMENDGFIREEWLRHWETLPITLHRSKIDIIVDPSFSKTGDYKAFGVIAPFVLDSKSKDFGTWKDANGEPFEEDSYDIIIDVYDRPASNIEFLVALYEYYQKYRPRHVKIEGVFNQKIFWLNEYKRFSRNPKYGKLPLKFFSPEAIPKDDRVAQLQSPIQYGSMLFPVRSEKNQDLETFIIQLVRYGQQGIKKDGPDMLASAYSMNHRKEKYNRKSRT
jgi:hypothetical protein